MHRANTLGETPIPPKAPAPEPFSGPAECATHQATLAALARLMVLATYLWVMARLGYRFRRIRKPAAGTRPASCLAPRGARTPRRRQPGKYFDRDFCLGLLAQANAAMRDATPAAPPPVPIMEPPSAPTLASAGAPTGAPTGAPVRPRGRAPRIPSHAHRRSGPSMQKPPRDKKFGAFPPPPPRVHFVPQS